MVNNLKTVLSSVRAALMRRGRTSDDADDLVQDAWLKLADYQRQHTVAEPAAFLMRTALNLSIDAYRASQRRGEQVALEDVQLVDATPTAEAVMLAREQIERLTAPLASLDARTRSIFLAHRVEGSSYLEIAREHRLSISAVEKHIAKAVLVLTRSQEGW